MLRLKMIQLQNNFRAILLACVFMSPGWLWAQQAPIDRFYTDIVLPEQNAAQSKMDVINYTETSNYDMQFQHCYWTILPEDGFISGNINSTLTLLEEAAEIHMDASDSLNIMLVEVNGEAALFTHVDNDLSISFGINLPAGTQLEIVVSYMGFPTATGLGSFTTGENEAGIVLWTLSQPYGANDWWPCKQSLSDKLDSITLEIKVPSIYQTGAPGILTNIEPDAEGMTLYTWKHKHPIPTYLVGIVVAQFEEYTFDHIIGDDTLLIQNMVYAESLPDAIGGIDAFLPAFDLLDSIYGQYPFMDEKYGHMQFSRGGGMEHQTMSSVTNYYYELLVHEATHQWFGNKVTCGSWQDIWLNEGFATYTTWMSFQLLNDPNGYFEGWLQTSKDLVISQPDGSVWVDDTTSSARIFDRRLTYYKGAWLLHMLRWEVGDDAFFTGLYNYINDPELEWGFARVDDFIKHVEAAADTSLASFFDDWYYGEGFPQYTILYNQGLTNGPVQISLSQRPSDPSVDFFEMHVPLRLIGDTDTMDIVLHNTQNGQIFSIDRNFTIRKIEFDPELKLLQTNATIAELFVPESVLALELYPNPATTELRLQVVDQTTGNFNVSVWNMAADLVFQEQIYLDGQHGLFVLDVAHWPAGTYRLLCKGDTEEIVKSFVISSH